MNLTRCAGDCGGTTRDGHRLCPECQMSYVRELKQDLDEALDKSLKAKGIDDSGRKLIAETFIEDADRDLDDPTVSYAWGRLLGAAEMVDMTVTELLDEAEGKQRAEAAEALRDTLHSDLSHAKDNIVLLTDEVERLRAALEDASPWPTDAVLFKLIEAANILLDAKCYDGDKWELIDMAREAALRQAPAIRAALADTKGGG